MPPFATPLDPAQRYLMGLSGGRDSVALLHALLEAGINKLVICHVNHRLRGRESGQDARFVRHLAKKYNLNFELGSFPVAELATQRGWSIETAARHTRYDFFVKCAKKHRCPRLILAHHADDQAETVLFNLLRGSAGTKGMRPLSQRTIQGYPLNLLRPWLELPRAEIDRYVSTHGLKFREDSTNALALATRNRLRHEALPLLNDILQRDVSQALARAARHQAELDDTMSALLEQLELLDPQGRLFLPKLQKLTPLLQKQALHQYLQTAKVPDIDRSLLERARDLIIPGGHHVINLPGGRQLRRKEARIFIHKAES